MVTPDQVIEIREQQQRKLVSRIMEDLEYQITKALKAAAKRCTVSVSTDDWYVDDSKDLRESQGAVLEALSKKYTSASIAIRWKPDGCYALCWKPTDRLQATLIWI